MSRFAPRLATLLVVVALAGAALAGGGRAAADDYSDATLEAFVSAAIEVSRRIEAWRPQIESEADEEVRNRVIDDARADIARAIADAAGITGDEYYAIFEAAQRDETLRGRIDRLFSSRRQRRRRQRRRKQRRRAAGRGGGGPVRIARIAARSTSPPASRSWPSHQRRSSPNTPSAPTRCSTTSPRSRSRRSTA